MITLIDQVARELWNMYCDECGTDHNWGEQDELEKYDYRERAARIIKMVRKSKEGVKP